MTGIMERSTDSITYLNIFCVFDRGEKWKRSLGILYSIEWNLRKRACSSLSLMPPSFKISVFFLQVRRV